MLNNKKIVNKRNNPHFIKTNTGILNKNFKKEVKV